MMWEYKLLAPENGTAADLEKLLNKLGAEGWRLTPFQGIAFLILERPKPEEPPQPMGMKG